VKTSWSRWRSYFERIEDLLRLSGEQLDAEQRELRDDYDYDGLSGGDRRQIDREVVRRAAIVPFFSELVAAARRLHPEDSLDPRDPGMLAPWNEGETARTEASADRGAAEEPHASTCSPERSRDGRPPQRLMNAERVLAGRTRSLTVVLDDLSNPLNASAVVRSAEALGLQEIHFSHPRGRVVLNPGIHKECHRWLDLSWHRDAPRAAEALKTRGYSIWGADFGEGSVPVDEMPLAAKTALVFGNEQTGLSGPFRAQVDGLFHIASAGFTTYVNVSNAAAISIAIVDRRLREAGLREPLDEDEKRRLRRAWYAMLARTPRRRREYLEWADDPPAAAGGSLRHGER